MRNYWVISPLNSLVQIQFRWSQARHGLLVPNTIPAVPLHYRAWMLENLVPQTPLPDVSSEVRCKALVGGEKAQEGRLQQQQVMKRSEAEQLLRGGVAMLLQPRGEQGAGHFLVSAFHPLLSFALPALPVLSYATYCIKSLSA